MLTRDCFLHEPCKTDVNVASVSGNTTRTRSAYKCRFFTFRRCSCSNARQLTVIKGQTHRGGHMQPAAVAGNLSLGIDCGTSGARSIVIDGMHCRRDASTVSLGACKQSAYLCTQQVTQLVTPGDRKIVFETQATLDKLQSEDWVAPWTRYISLLPQANLGKHNILCCLYRPLANGFKAKCAAPSAEIRAQRMAVNKALTAHIGCLIHMCMP